MHIYQKFNSVVAFVTLLVTCTTVGWCQAITDGCTTQARMAFPFQSCPNPTDPTGGDCATFNGVPECGSDSAAPSSYYGPMTYRTWVAAQEPGTLPRYQDFCENRNCGTCPNYTSCSNTTCSSLHGPYTDSENFTISGTVTDQTGWSVTAGGSAGNGTSSANGSGTVSGSSSTADTISVSYTITTPIDEGKIGPTFDRPAKPSPGMVRGIKIRAIPCDIIPHIDVRQCSGWLNKGHGNTYQCPGTCTFFERVVQGTNSASGSVSTKVCDYLYYLIACN